MNNQIMKKISDEIIAIKSKNYKYMSCGSEDFIFLYNELNTVNCPMLRIYFDDKNTMRNIEEIIPCIVNSSYDIVKSIIRSVTIEDTDMVMEKISFYVEKDGDTYRINLVLTPYASFKGIVYGTKFINIRVAVQFMKNLSALVCSTYNKKVIIKIFADRNDT